MQVELLQPHIHALKPYPVGSVIVLGADLAQWLIETGIAQGARATPPTVPESESGLSTLSRSARVAALTPASNTVS